MDLRTLSVQNVVDIHNELVADFADTDDPIDPPVKSMSLLESAVSRQFTSFGDDSKYPDPIHNAATLTYGICHDHPFHNGNKRTALVTMLVHLDKNKLTFTHTRKKELYEMILTVGLHALMTKEKEKRTSKLPLQDDKDTINRPDVDDEVEAIARWIKERATNVTRGERQITYRELRKILRRFGYELAYPKGNSINIVTTVTKKKRFSKETKQTEKSIGSISYPGDNVDVPIKILKQVRFMCRLREEDGIDSDTFYSDGIIIDAFINKYRTILRKLANR